MISISEQAKRGIREFQGESNTPTLHTKRYWPEPPIYIYIAVASLLACLLRVSNFIACFDFTVVHECMYVHVQRVIHVYAYLIFTSADRGSRVSHQRI